MPVRLGIPLWSDGKSSSIAADPMTESDVLGAA